jgi:hypothetical protein
MNTYRIEFLKTVYQKCSVEINACSEREAEDLFYDNDAFMSLADVFVVDDDVEITDTFLIRKEEEV